MRWMLLVFITGCSAAARLPASYFAEGGDVMPAGQIALTGAAGGAATVDGNGGGGGARVRVGVGGGQELGLEVAAVSITGYQPNCTFDCGGDDSETRFDRLQKSGMLTWKSQLRPELAVIVGAGVAEHEDTSAMRGAGDDAFGRTLTGSIAAVRSWRHDETTGFYTGARLSLGVPIGRKNADDATPAAGIVGVLGLNVTIASHTHLFLEAGPQAVFDAFVLPSLGATAVAGVTLIL